MSDEEVYLQVPGTPAYISVVRQAIVGIATRMSFSHQDVQDLQLAVGEACNNAVRHGLNDCIHPVRIRCRIDPDMLCIEVKNHYNGVPPSSSAGSMPEPCQYHEGGMGIFLMKTLVDAVDFRWGKGTATVRLTKALRTA